VTQVRDVLPFAFSLAQHERMAVARLDPDRLADLWGAASSRAAVVGDGRVRTRDGEPLWLPTGDAPEGERVLLGRADGSVWWAVVVDDPGQDHQAQTLRELAPYLSARDCSLLAEATGLANWHRVHPRCARCGESTDVAEAGHVRRCPACGATHFPRTDPAVIMLITDDQDRALLGRSPAWPPGRFSTLAGFVEPGETLEDAVRREVMEESSIVVGEVNYAASQAWPFPTGMMIGFVGRAVTFDITVDGLEMEQAKWFTRDEVSVMLSANSVPSTMSISSWLINTWLTGH